MAFPPDSCRCYEEESCDTDSKQVIARGKSHFCKCCLEEYRQGDSVGGEKRAQRRCYDRENREDDEYGVAFP